LFQLIFTLYENFEFYCLQDNFRLTLYQSSKVYWVQWTPSSGLLLPAPNRKKGERSKNRKIVSPIDIDPTATNAGGLTVTPAKPAGTLEENLIASNIIPQIKILSPSFEENSPARGEFEIKGNKEKLIFAISKLNFGSFEMIFKKHLCIKLEKLVYLEFIVKRTFEVSCIKLKI